jgi:predicted deacetylase
MNAARRFVVSLHDVAPAAGEEIACILKELQPRVGRAISAAVIPAPFAQNRGAGLAARVRGQCREIALHGYSHHGPAAFHPMWLLTGDCLEFIGLPPSEARARLQRGQEILHAMFRRPASVLVPPAWCAGAVTPAMAASFGLSALVTWRQLVRGTTRIPLAVHSWDCGRFAWLAYVGEFYGYLRRHAGAAIPCVTLHPRDVSRNLLTRGLRVIDHFLRRGFSPATFAEVASLAPPGSPGETTPVP